MAKRAAASSEALIVVSVIMPCLNEAESVGRCVDKALEGIRRTGLPGEVVVCDNGSEDDSARIAKAHGARVVHQAERGYGNACAKGLRAARGRYLVMGDADDTYDFADIPRFVALLQEGYDYVLGSRMKGEILPGAMPWTHRYLGNPALTWILNRLSGTDVSDAHSGMRAFTRLAFQRLSPRSGGMEFASEIAIKAARSHLKSIELPITYRPGSVGRSSIRCEMGCDISAS